MEITPEIIDIGDINKSDSNILELKPSVSFDDEIDTEVMNSAPKQSSNFGAGIELLMNDKKKTENKKTTDVKIDDIENLEEELNNLSDSINKPSEKKEPGIFGGLFNIGKSKTNDKNVSKLEKNNTEDDLGKNTAEYNETKSWDGYGKFNDVPITKEQYEKPKLTREEELKEKFKYLRKLEDLERKGATLSQKYTMDSDLNEMMGEYETIVSEKKKSNAIKFQGKMLMAAVTGIEFLNSKFDPFDIKLEGWSEQLNENIDDYDDIFAELHEKYKSKASMAPELRLLFQLGGSAAMMHMTNTMFKSSMPGMDDIMRQNPELMKEFSKAAVNTMGENNPGFGGFMNNIMGNNFPQQREEVINVGFGPPPTPVETKLPDRSRREAPMMNRPDLKSASSGVNIDNQYGSPIIEETILEPPKPQKSVRPEMKGPDMANAPDVNNILSGLKTKQINIGENKEKNNTSTISIEELKELSNTKLPKTKRKQKSDKNTISLDI